MTNFRHLGHIITMAPAPVIAVIIKNKKPILILTRSLSCHKKVEQDKDDGDWHSEAPLLACANCNSWNARKESRLSSLEDLTFNDLSYKGRILDNKKQPLFCVCLYSLSVSRSVYEGRALYASSYPEKVMKALHLRNNIVIDVVIWTRSV